MSDSAELMGLKRAELTEREREFLGPDQALRASVFKATCANFSDGELYSYLRIIVQIAMERGLIQWFTEATRVQ